MKRTDQNTSLQELKELVAQFRDERQWAKHHSPKNLAISIALEAAELLENFQWDAYTKTDKQKMTEELADILIYCFNFADTMDIDVATAFRDKLEKAAQKYPAEIFNGNDDAEDYQRVKQAFRRSKK